MENKNQKHDEWFIPPEMKYIFLKEFRGNSKGTLDRSVMRRINKALQAIIFEGWIHDKRYD